MKLTHPKAISPTYASRLIQIICLILGLSLALSGCESKEGSSGDGETGAGISGGAGDDGAEEVNMNPIARFELDSELSSTPLGAVPFPHDLYRDDAGGLKLTGFPNQLGVLAQLVSEIEAGTAGFGTTSGLFLSFASPIDTAALPQDGGESLRDDATLALIDIDPESPELGRRWPIYWKFAEEETTYLPANTLSVRLLEGIALRPKTQYALIVTETLAAPAPEFEAMLGEEEPIEL